MSYEATGLDGYIFLATLDLGTSDICQFLDGKRFKLKDAQVGKNYPPMHPNCRSTTIPDVDGTLDGDRQMVNVTRLMVTLLTKNGTIAMQQPGLQ